MMEKWYENQGELLTFLRALHSGGEFSDIDGVLYFLEKPWKYEPEHAHWIAIGAPAELADSDELRTDLPNGADSDNASKEGE